MLVTTVKPGYNELDITNTRLLRTNVLFPNDHFTTFINPGITNPGHNEEIWTVPS